MFCTNCGAQLDDDVAFCVKCGSSVNKDAHAVADEAAPDDTASEPEDVDAEPAPVVSEGMPKDASEQEASEDVSQGKKPRKGLIIGIIIVAVVIVAAVAGILIWQHFEYEKAHQPVVVSINAEIEDSSIEETSGVPISVQGIDLDNNAVGEEILVVSSSDPIELLRGEYTVTVLGNPIGKTGNVYRDFVRKVSLAIDADSVSVDGQAVDTSSDDDGRRTLEVVMRFIAIPPQDVTDEELVAVRDWMESFGLSSDEIDGYINAATQARQAALDRIAEEERKRAEEEARARAEALRQAAFGSFPADFSFSSGAGGWSTDITIQPDGSFKGQWHDTNMGESGPGYSWAVHICEFAGSFSVIEQVNATTFKLQLNEVHPTTRAREEIKDECLYTYYDDEPYGLGGMRSTPVQGWTLYMPGTSSSALTSTEKGWLFGVGSTLTKMVLTNGEFTWSGTTA